MPVVFCIAVFKTLSYSCFVKIFTLLQVCKVPFAFKISDSNCSFLFEFQRLRDICISFVLFIRWISISPEPLRSKN